MIGVNKLPARSGHLIIAIPVGRHLPAIPVSNGMPTLIFVIADKAPSLLQTKIIRIHLRCDL